MFYDSIGQAGNIGYLSQANPNPLSDPRNRIPGAFPNSFPMLPGEDPGAIKGVYGTPNQGQPFMNTPARLPLAKGAAGDIGNMAGMAGMSGMEGAQLAGGITPKGGFNLFNPFNLKDNVNKTLNTGASPTTPAGQMINGMKRNRDQYEQLRRQGIL